jgi:hypothetical protein
MMGGGGYPGMGWGHPGMMGWQHPGMGWDDDMDWDHPHERWGHRGMGMGMGWGHPGMMGGPGGMMGRGGQHFQMMIPMMMAMMDTNNDGALSLEEVQAVHGRMFNFIDSNKDGKVTPAEVQTAFRGGAQAPANQ